MERRTDLREETNSHFKYFYCKRAKKKSLVSINRLVFIMSTDCVFWEEGIWFLSFVYMNLVLQVITFWSKNVLKVLNRSCGCLVVVIFFTKQPKQSKFEIILWPHRLCHWRYFRMPRNTGILCVFFEHELYL